MLSLIQKFLERNGGVKKERPSTTTILTDTVPPQPGDSVRVTIAEPTVVHVTHWKAGSQWIGRILHALAYDRLIVPASGKQEQFLKSPILPGKVYPTVYVTKDQFDQVGVPKNHRRFVMIRDLRDTLVSVYFSVKVSHALVSDELKSMRGDLVQQDQEAGLLSFLDEFLPACAAIQESWLNGGEPLLRYEDLLDNDIQILEAVLLGQCELQVTRERFREVILANRFERLSGGRHRGQEDITAHERKGISGDWRNHFTDRITRSFKERFGKLLIATGYEKDLDWRADPTASISQPSYPCPRAA